MRPPQPVNAPFPLQQSLLSLDFLSSGQAQEVVEAGLAAVCFFAVLADARRREGAAEICRSVLICFA